MDVKISLRNVFHIITKIGLMFTKPITVHICEEIKVLFKCYNFNNNYNRINNNQIASMDQEMRIFKIIKCNIILHQL
jgi:hypothetical protein